jgi:hypothetical protein
MSSKHRIACWIVASAALFSFLWAISSMEFLFPALSPAGRHINAMGLVILWALGPAIWLLAEWWFWRSEAGLEVGQRYARDCWLGAGAIILLLAAHTLESAPVASSGQVITWNLQLDLVKALVWPVVAIVGFVMFRTALGAFLAGIGSRASKIGAFNVSIELAALPDAQRWSGPSLDDLKEEYPSTASDSSGSLFKTIADTAHADYVTVDLKAGQEWLTSRLFILTTLISKVRPIQRIVFLNGSSATFLGECAPAAISQTLAKKYPWFEEAYISAVATTNSYLMNQQRRVSMLGKISPEHASSVLGYFLGTVKTVPTPIPNPAEWIDFNTFKEHAEWVSDTSLVQLMGRSLNTVPVQRNPSQDGVTAARTLLRHDEDYVAVVDMAGRFLRLVDRRKANDDFVRRGLAETK